MRWFFYLLVVANLLLFLWIFQSENRSDSRVAVMPEVGDIRVIDEAEIALIPDVIQQVTEDEYYCSTIGKFLDRDVADRLGMDLAGSNIASSIKMTVEASIQDYMVVIPQVSDTDSAGWIMRKLLESGFESPWAISEGEHSGGISLGVFRNRENALRQKQKAAKLGLEVQVIERSNDQEVYRVNLKGHIEEVASKELIESLNLKYGPFEISEKRCIEIVQTR